MMRKLLFILVLGIAILLSSCSKEVSVYNFKVRKDDYYISEDNLVIIEYKTNEDGKLVKLNIDRLLSVEDMLYFNPIIDYDYILEGYNEDIFISPGYFCTAYNSMLIPANIEVGSTRLKYNQESCEYIEVDRNNDFKTGTYIRSYKLSDTIGVSKDIIVSIVIYDENSIEKYIDIIDLPHTEKLMGTYSIEINSSRDGYANGVTNYYKDMAIYEQLMLKYQQNDLAVLEILGFTIDINLLDFDQMAKVIPMIEGFEVQYETEISALSELVSLIGVVNTETVSPIE